FGIWQASRPPFSKPDAFFANSSPMPSSVLEDTHPFRCLPRRSLAHILASSWNRMRFPDSPIACLEDGSILLPSPIRARDPILGTVPSLPAILSGRNSNPFHQSIMSLLIPSSFLEEAKALNRSIAQSWMHLPASAIGRKNCDLYIRPVSGR